MKRNVITLITAGVLVLIFLFMLFSFQVRRTEVAVVTTFGRFSRSITNAGFQLRWPWPIQKVHEFDNRTQTFERKFDQTITADQINLIVSVFTGWRIHDPRLFLESFGGDLLKAEQTLEPLVRNAKSGVIGQHNFGDLISTNAANLKFDEIEQEMLTAVRDRARGTYGIEVEFLGVKQLGLPQSITTTVFDRMKAERQTLVAKYQADGEREASVTRASADGRANEILAEARAEAKRIIGEADKTAAEFYAQFEKNRDLALFLFNLKALEDTLKAQTYLILGPQSPPFNLLNSAPRPSSAPAPAR